MKAAKLLVFGRGGQVGGELVRLLARKDLTVTAVDRTECDLSKPGAAAELIDRISPKFIVNAAAYTAVDRAESEAELAERLNCEAVGEMAAAAKNAGAVLIHYSTDYVFNGNSDRPWVETDATGPLNTYGRSKLNGEKAALSSGAIVFVFRTSWVYGAQGANFVRTMLKFGAEREDLNVVGDQRGAPTWSRSLAELAMHTIGTVQKADGSVDEARAAELGGIYHASAEGVTTWHGFAEAIFKEARALGMPVRVKSVRKIRTEDWPTPAERPRYSVLSNEKLRNRLGYVLSPWQDSLRSVLREIREAKG